MNLPMPDMITHVARWIANRKAPIESDPHQDSSAVEGAEPGSFALIRNGEVWIQDGKVFVENPEPGGDYAILTVPDDNRVRVSVDGHIVSGSIVVTNNQKIEMETSDTPPALTFSCHAGSNSFEVIGRVDVCFGETCHVKDCGRARHVMIELQTERTGLPVLSALDVEVALAAKGYCGAVDRDAIDRLCHTTDNLELVVLRGKAPIRGRPRSYRPVDLPKVYDPLHRRSTLCSLTPGATIAVVIPEIPPAAGVDVYGQKRPAPNPRSNPVLGPGVVEVDGQLVAARGGRLLFTPRRIDVIPELVFEQDITNKDGKIEFDGDVVIHGSVFDGSFIQATGHIKIEGSVLGSTVMGERGVSVAHSIIGSKVIAGQSKLLYGDIYPMIRQCASEFNQFCKEHVQLSALVDKSPNSEIKEPMIADVLLAKRHPQLAQRLSYLSEDMSRLTETDDRYLRIVETLRTHWIGIGRTNLNADDVQFLHALLADYTAYLESIMSVEPADVTTASITSSSLRSSGKIVVTGAGTYSSSCEAGDCVTIAGTARGGFLVAGNMARIEELGTPFGTETSVKVLNRGGRISVQIRYSNTLLEVAGSRERNLLTEYNVVYRGDSNANPNVDYR